MRYARMLRLALRDRLQDGRALELVGVGLVGRRSRGVERERVVDLRFIVFRIALRQLFHGLGIGLGAGQMIDFVVVHVHRLPARRYSRARAGSWRRRSLPLAIDRRRPRRDSSQASGRGDSTTDSARCPNRRCRTRDRPSARPRIPFARRGTRTNAGTACRGQTAFALPACTMSRNAPCRAFHRRRVRTPAGARTSPIVVAAAMANDVLMWWLLCTQMNERAASCRGMSLDVKKGSAASHKRETGFL